MPVNRREFLIASTAGPAMLKAGTKGLAAPVGGLQVTVNASRTSEPVSLLVFGGYMEPATTRVWAEMLNDRKFARPITSAKEPMTSNPFFKGFQSRRWKPIGPEKSVVMDTVRPFVGKHSPRVMLAGSAPHGIQQTGMALQRGKAYLGRIYLKGGPAANVEVRLVWGSGAGDSLAIPMPSLSSEYRKFPLKLTSPVNAENVRFEITGTGEGSFLIGTVSLMPADNMHGFHAGMLKFYKEQGFAMAKWPGGNFVSAYDWHDGLGDRDKRPPRIGPVWPIVEPNDVGIHEFLDFCKMLGAEPYVAVNSGFGEAREAGKEVEYVNGSADTPMGKLRAANGHPEPFGVHLWCVGNEMYGPWQFGHMSLNQYWVKHNFFAEAMKKADPSIKLTVCGASPCEVSWCAAEQKQFEPSMWKPPSKDRLPFRFGSLHDWDGWLLAKCPGNIDHLSEHTYAFPDMEFDEQKQRFVDAEVPVQFRARRMANRICAAFEAWRTYITKMPWLKTENIKFAFDEWGNRFQTAHGKRRQASGMVNPLSYALYFHELFRHSDMVALSCPTHGFYTLVMDSAGEPVGLSVEGLVIKLMRAHFAGAMPVEVRGNSPQRPAGGTPMVDACSSSSGSPTYPLDVVAALSGDRKSFLLSVVNPTESDQEFIPQIRGAELRGPGTLWQIAAPNVHATNELGKKPVVDLVKIPVKALPNTVRVPRISINLYEYEIDA